MMWRAKYEKSLAMPTGWQQLPNGRAYCNALNAYFAPWFTKICGYQILKIGGLDCGFTYLSSHDLSLGFFCPKIGTSPFCWRNFGKI